MIAIYSERENLVITSVYRQPDSPTNPSKPYHLSQAFAKLETALQDINASPTLIICGDFNIPEINWEHGQPHSSQSQIYE